MGDSVPPPDPPQAPAAIFYSYSHKDEKLRDRLETHLALLKHDGLISQWHDRRVTSGTEWKGAIDDRLNTAGIILLLVSPDFLDSAYCYDVEMRLAMQRHQRGDARVIPVILRPCDWRAAPFAELRVLPTDGKPVVNWSNRDEAFLNIAAGIRTAVEETVGRDGHKPAASTSPKRTAVASPPRVEWIVELKTPSIDAGTIQAIVEFLRNLSGDAQLTLRRVEKGSVTLVLEGSETGFDRILQLFRQGDIRSISGFEIQDVRSGIQLTATHTVTAVDRTVELVKRAQSGDAQALDHLFARFLPPLRRWASGRLPRWTRDVMDTDDLVQETVMRAVKRIGSFEPRHDGAMQAYLREAVVNRIRDEMRRKSRAPAATELDEHTRDRGASPLDEAIGHEAVDRYEAALARLRPDEREAIVARVEMECTYQEVAQAMGKPSADAARMAVARALVRLAEEMSHGRA